MDLRLCCPFPAWKKRQNKTLKSAQKQNKKGATVAAGAWNLYKSTERKWEWERERERETAAEF